LLIYGVRIRISGLVFFIFVGLEVRGLGMAPICIIGAFFIEFDDLLSILMLLLEAYRLFVGLEMAVIIFGRGLCIRCSIFFALFSAIRVHIGVHPIYLTVPFCLILQPLY
jgi:hypothetical protein